MKISWTPYGKVREVSKNDGTVVKFRYDASGNRIEKKLTKPDNTTIVTRYVRDASGNVMGVYSGKLLSEQPIYGSSRLGSYKGGMHRALRKLGTKNFELSNHLGNVLSVITDNIRMTADSTWATVANANDYYAFGSSMPGRQITTPAPNASDRSLVLPGFASGDNSKILEDISNNFTVELWVNPTGTHEIDTQSASGTAGTTGQKYVIHPALGPTTTRAGMGISVGTNGVSVYEQTTSYMPATLVWTGTISGWTHIAVVYSNKRPNLYINGVFVKQGVISGKSLVHPSFGFMGSSQGSMAGSVDEIRIWNVIRTPTELLASYNTTIPGNTPNLAAYWPMNEGSGTMLHDASQHGLDHAVVNYTAWSAAGSGAPVTGNSDGQGNEYRYGFNGKEKDDNGEFGNTHYDYGFRIYNPSIGRFLSVDPLTKSYPELTPYQFASNKPINSIDLDGLEARTSIKGEFVNGHWTMGSDNHISLANEAEMKMKAQQAIMNKPFVPNYGTLRSNDITSTPEYKMFETNVNTYGDFVLPIDVSKRLIRGEEVPAWELGVEAAGFIPFGKVFGKGGKALIEGAIKVWKNGDEVLEVAYKFGKLGHKGTKSYNEAIDAVKKGGNFVASSQEEALEILNATFKNIPDETGKATSKFGYRIDEAVEALKDGLKQGHQGTHINYYDKANSVKGTIVIE